MKGLKDSEKNSPYSLEGVVKRRRDAQKKIRNICDDPQIAALMQRMQESAEKGAKKAGITKQEFIKRVLKNPGIGPHCPECGVFGW